MDSVRVERSGAEVKVEEPPGCGEEGKSVKGNSRLRETEGR